MGKQSENALAAIDRAIFKSDEPVVVALTGGWGEGKTYFWQNAISAKQVTPPMYVSVFGADSLQAIRERVALSTIPRTEGAIGTVLKGARDAVTSLIGISASLTVDLLERTRLQAGQVVCLDDVERLSEEIGFNNFLGYVSELRDRWKLKVVLIFNKDRVANNDVFQLYREKVIDREIPFVLDFDELVSLVFRDVNIPKFDLAAEARRNAEVLGLRNIRILVKTRSYFQELVGQLPDRDAADFLKAVFASLLLFTYTKFSGDKPQGLTFEMLKKHDEWTDRARRSAGLKQDEDAPVDPAKSLLERYMYVTTDDVDRFLIEFINTDVLDVPRLLELYIAHRLNADKAALSRSFQQVWDTRYHGTFADNAETLCDALEGALGPYIQYVPPNELDFALVVLMRLGRPEAAKRYFEEFRRLRGDTFEKLDGDSMPRGPYSYPGLKKYFEKIAQRRKADTRTIDEVLTGAFKERFIQQRDAERLNQFSVTELRGYFASHDQPKLTAKLRMLTKDTGNDDLRKKALKVAERLAKKGALNRMRLEGMGLVKRKVRLTPRKPR